MRKNFGSKPILYPMPVLIIGTYDENGNANAMNAAWGGISNDFEISVCLSENHKTVKNLENTKAFTVSVATAKTVVECDYFGIASGNDGINKIEKANFHVQKSEFVNAPLFDELPLALECEVISYKDECLKGKIVNVSALDEILTDEKIDVRKLDPITYDCVNHKYLRLGEVVGNAFSDGKALK